MPTFFRLFIALAPFFFLTAAETRTASAIGALAINNCGAYGYSHNYNSFRAARRRALSECRGDNCRIVTTIDGNCAAYATDHNRSCGAWGWGRAATRGRARQIALDYCLENGGRNCRVRVSVCD